MKSSRPIGKNVCIGHVHLKVADLERALGFYCGVLGFELTARYGSEAAFVSWTESEAFRKAHGQGKVGQLLAGPPRFVGWEVVL